MTAILRFSNGYSRPFDTLHKALTVAWEQKVTGTVELDNGETIELKKGKRPGVKPKTWVPCDPNRRSA
jgi:hypothetical protein